MPNEYLTGSRASPFSPPSRSGSSCGDPGYITGRQPGERNVFRLVSAATSTRDLNKPKNTPDSHPTILLDNTIGAVSSTETDPQKVTSA